MMIYYSKVSFTLLIIIFIVFFGPVIPSYLDYGFNSNLFLITLVLILIYGFILHMFFNTSYTIKDEKLYIKCGFFNYKPIAISEMKKVSNSSSIISSPAASFDRIEITYGKFDELIISPKDKTKFVDDLLKINPELINKL